MRRLIRFPCGGDMLSGSLDDGERSTGLILVTGGSQVRAGPHRMLHMLAAHVAQAGLPAFRYERRGVGDSDGEDPGYHASGPDLTAAVAAFRVAAPHVTQIVGFGLCDGATTLALHGRAAGIAAIILANPWLVEVQSGELAPAAVRAHYGKRLASSAAWSSVFKGRVNIFGAARSLLGPAAKTSDQSLADDIARCLLAYRGKLMLILARGDNTAITAKSCWSSPAFADFHNEDIVEIDTDSHTFARTDDLLRLQRSVLDFMQAFEKPN